MSGWALSRAIVLSSSMDPTPSQVVAGVTGETGSSRLGEWGGEGGKSCPVGVIGETALLLNVGDGDCDRTTSREGEGIWIDKMS